jgi:hypothetical protein
LPGIGSDTCAIKAHFPRKGELFFNDKPGGLSSNCRQNPYAAHTAATSAAGQKLGIKEVDEGIWLASFMHYDLGYFDLEQKTLQPLDNSNGPRLLPMS